MLLQGRLIQAQESFQDLDKGIKLNALRELIKDRNNKSSTQYKGIIEDKTEQGWGQK